MSEMIRLKPLIALEAARGVRDYQMTNNGSDLGYSTP